MDDLINLSDTLRTLKYTPKAARYEGLLGWLDRHGLGLLRMSLRIDLEEMIFIPIEIPVQRLDSDDILYYQAKSTDTFNDFKEWLVDHENIHPNELGFMLVSPDVMYNGERVSGKSTILADLDEKLSTLGDRRLVIFPSPIMNFRLNWDEKVDRQLTVYDEHDLTPFPVQIGPTTTVGQLKRKLWPFINVAPTEQIIRAALGVRPVLDDTYVLGHTRGVRLDVKRYPLEVVESGPVGNSRHINITVRDSGRALIGRIAAYDFIDHIVPDRLWLGPSGDPQSQDITEEEYVLYLLAAHPDKEVYVDMPLPPLEEQLD